MIKAVIFDMDGVLINTEPLHYQCWVEIFKERYGIDLDYDVYKPCIGSTRFHFMNLIKENYGITFESLEVMNQIMKEKKDEIIARDGFPEMPGVGQMLCCLKDAGYRLAVASSSPKPVITETLETLDLMKYFDVVTSGESKAGTGYISLCSETVGRTSRRVYCNRRFNEWRKGC